MDKWGGFHAALIFAISRRFVALVNVSVNPFLVFIPWILPMKGGDYNSRVQVLLELLHAESDSSGR